MVVTIMGSALLRTGSLKLLPVGLNCGLCKITRINCNVTVTQVAFITGKAARTDRPPRPPPFDYMRKPYRSWHVFTDPMEKRLDDNSKIVVVDGLPGSGKEKFAKELAEELEMFYMPPYTFDDFLINKYGFDRRSLNSKLPIDAQYFDDKMFLADPFGRNSGAVQWTYYFMRLRLYCLSLLHLFSTGQGVVLNRSPYSDFVFMKAMLDSGYVSQGVMRYYKDVLARTQYLLLRPHLAIYLDIPSTVSKERINRRGLPHEVNSKAFTPKFLSDIEKNYKDLYIPQIEKHAHMLMYDWTEGGLIDDVVHDIESLQFDGYDRDTEKMSDWLFATWEDRRVMRNRFANELDFVLSEALVVRFDVPEMILDADDNLIRADIVSELAEFDKTAGLHYVEGWNPGLDKGLLFKTEDDTPGPDEPVMPR